MIILIIILKNPNVKKYAYSKKRECNEFPAIYECEISVEIMKNKNLQDKMNLRRNFTKCF